MKFSSQVTDCAEVAVNFVMCPHSTNSVHDLCPPFSLLYIGVGMVMPGDNTELTIEIGQPIPLEVNQRFTLREGRMTVGTGVITEVVQ